MSLSDKIVVVTGCTNGIGAQIAVQLSDHSPKVLVLVNRSRERAQALIDNELKTLDGFKNTVFHSVVADLGEPSEVERAVAEIKSLEGIDRVDVFINNAGIWLAEKERYGGKVTMNKCGKHEVHFATNYLSMVILCQGLRELVKKSDDGRMIITGSFTSLEMIKGVIPGGISNLSGPDIKTDKGGMTANDITYPQSKLAQHMWARWFARECKDSDFHIVVWCPGMVVTNIDAWQVMMSNAVMRFMINCCMKPRTPAITATSCIRLATMDGAEFSKVEQSAETLPRGRTPGERGLYLDTGKTKSPRFWLSGLPYYSTFKKEAPATSDWAEIERLVKFTDEQLAL